MFHQFRALSTAHVRFVRFLHGMRVRMRLMLVSSAASGETRSGAARRRNQIGPPGVEPRRSSRGATEPAVSERQYSGRLTGARGPRLRPAAPTGVSTAADVGACLWFFSDTDPTPDLADATDRLYCRDAICSDAGSQPNRAEQGSACSSLGASMCVTRPQAPELNQVDGNIACRVRPDCGAATG